MRSRESDKSNGEEEMAALKASKKALRSLMKTKLLAVTTDSIQAQSSRIFKALIDSKGYSEAKRIGIYLSMPTGEVQTDSIVRHALENGKQVFVPYLHKAQSPPPDTPLSVMEMVDLKSLSEYESLRRDNRGIPTIASETVHARESILEKDSRGLDLILLPGVAFEKESAGKIKRLGHGKGYYDFFLHRYRQHQASQDDLDVMLLGLALQEQYLESELEHSVPTGPHDSFLDGLMVGDGIIISGSFT